MSNSPLPKSQPLGGEIVKYLVISSIGQADDTTDGISLLGIILHSVLYQFSYLSKSW